MSNPLVSILAASVCEWDPRSSPTRRLAPHTCACADSPRIRRERLCGCAVVDCASAIAVILRVGDRVKVQKTERLADHQGALTGAFPRQNPARLARLSCCTSCAVKGKLASLVLRTLDSAVGAAERSAATASKFFSVVPFDTGEMLRFLQFPVIVYRPSTARFN